MPWDKEFSFDPIDGETPPELLAAVEQVLLDDEVRLESITLARRRRDAKTAKPSASYVKWSTYVVDVDQTAEEICAVLIGGAYACAESDGDLSVNKYECTIVWTIRATAKKDRTRSHFELDESRRKVPKHSPGPKCPACAAYRDMADYFKGRVGQLERALTEETKRTEAALKAERENRDKAVAEQMAAREKLAAEMMEARDKLVLELINANTDFGKDYAKLAQDYARIGTEAAKDAREAYRPTEQSTAQILGMLAAAVDAYKGAIDARSEHADAIANERNKQARNELAKQSLGMIEKLAMRVIARKFGKNDDTDDDKQEGKTTAKATAMDKLRKTRDELFAKATDKDWQVLREGAGAEFVGCIEAMREGEIDLAALEGACDKLAREKSPRELMSMLNQLTEPIQDIMMDIGDLVGEARKETGK
jgi:hypothetical protein